MNENYAAVKLNLLLCPQGEIGDPGLRGEEGAPGRHVRLYICQHPASVNGL